jgi:hypothetical protein
MWVSHGDNWDVTPFSQLDIYQRFGEKSCLHLQGVRQSQQLLT